MNKTIHKLCIWSMLIMIGFFTVGTILAGVFPPPSPLRTATELAHYLNANAVSVRLGYIIMMFGCGFILPFAGGLAWETQKMSNGGDLSGAGRNIAANIQLTGTLVFGIAIFIPSIFFMASAFRPLDDIMVTQGLYDAAFILFVAPVSTGTIWMLFLGIAMLLDTQQIKTFPRWFGYYTLFVAFDFAGGGFCVLTKTGPFAWDGVISYWIPFITWGFWAVGMTKWMLASLEREYAGIPTPTA